MALLDIRTGKEMTRGGFLKGILAAGIAPSIVGLAGSANGGVGRGMMRSVGARNAAMFGGIKDDNLWRRIDYVENQETALTPTTPINPSFGNSIYNCYNVGYGYFTYFTVIPINGGLGFQATRFAGNENYSIGQFLRLTTGKRYRFTYDTDTPSTFYRIRVQLLNEGEGGFYYRALKNLFNSEFVAQPYDVHFIGFLMTTTRGDVFRATNIRLIEI